MSLRPVQTTPPARWPVVSPKDSRPAVDPLEIAREDSPRARANDIVFGHPTHGGAEAEAFLDRLMAESGRRPHRRGALDASSRPMPELVQTYAGLLRNDTSAASSDYRKSVTGAFADRPAEERLRLDTWLDHAATFCRRASDLLARTLQKADANLAPFVSQVVQAQIDQGLHLLRLENALPPTLTPLKAVLDQANAARLERLADIEAFYRSALTGNTIAGLPPRKQDQTFWLRDGRLIFNDVAQALSMAPRPGWLRKYTGPIPISVIQYGPPHFDGPRPRRIEYRDPHFKPGFLAFADNVYAPIEFDPDPDGDTARDLYRLRDGPWRSFDRATTPEIEQQKARWYVTLQSAAAQAVG